MIFCGVFFVFSYCLSTLCVFFDGGGGGGGGGIFGAVHSLRVVLMGIRCLIFMSLRV